MGDLTMINLRAVVKGGVILSKLTHLFNNGHNNHGHHNASDGNGSKHKLNNNSRDHLSHLISSSDFSNSTTINDVNKFTTQRPNVDLGVRMTTGLMQSGGIKKTLRLLPTRPWGLSLSVGGVAG